MKAKSYKFAKRLASLFLVFALLFSSVPEMLTINVVASENTELGTEDLDINSLLKNDNSAIADSDSSDEEKNTDDDEEDLLSSEDDLDDDEDAEDEELAEDDEILVDFEKTFSAFSTGAYTYSLNLFNVGDDDITLTDVEAGEELDVTWETPVGGYRRGFFSSDEDKLTVRISGITTTGLGAYDGLVAFTADHNHAYLQSGIDITFYMAVDAINDLFTPVILKKSAVTKRWLAPSITSLTGQIYASTGNQDPISETLTPFSDLFPFGGSTAIAYNRYTYSYKSDIALDDVREIKFKFGADLTSSDGSWQGNIFGASATALFTLPEYIPSNKADLISIKGISIGSTTGAGTSVNPYETALGVSYFTEKITVEDLIVPYKASAELYSDSIFSNEIFDSSFTVDVPKIIYIKVTANDGTEKFYAVEITRLDDFFGYEYIIDLFGASQNAILTDIVAEEVITGVVWDTSDTNYRRATFTSLEPRLSIGISNAGGSGTWGPFGNKVALTRQYNHAYIEVNNGGVVYLSGTPNKDNVIATFLGPRGGSGFNYQSSQMGQDGWFPDRAVGIDYALVPEGASTTNLMQLQSQVQAYSTPFKFGMNFESPNWTVYFGRGARRAEFTMPGTVYPEYVIPPPPPDLMESHLIIEMAGRASQYPRPDIHMWAHGSGLNTGLTEYSGAMNKFIWNEDNNLANVLVRIDGRLGGKMMGFVVRPTGILANAQVINGYAATIDSGVDGALNRYFTPNKIEPNTKLRLTANQKEFKVLARAVSFTDNNQFEFRWRDQMTFITERTQEDFGTVPRVRFGTESTLSGEGEELSYNAAEDMYVLRENIIGTPGSAIYYEFSNDGGTTWYPDLYNLDKDGYSRLGVAAASSKYAKFAHSSIKLNENNVLEFNFNGTAKADDIYSITADLRDFGLSEIETITELTPRSYAKVVASRFTGTRKAVVTIMFNNGEVQTDTITMTVTNTTDSWDWDEARIYFLLTDRFAKGEEGEYGYSAHAPGYAPLVDTRSFDTIDNEHGRRLGTYHGGNLKGITKKLDYLKDLGINTVWITPIVENIKVNLQAHTGNDDHQYAIHGYWAEDFTKLDPTLGTEADLRELIRELHKRDMKLMVDVVLNHSGYGMTNVHADSANTDPKFILDSGASMFRPITDEPEYPGGPIVYPATGNELTDALSGLPDFRTEDLEVRDLLVRWQTKWVEEFGVDYFRLDTTKHVEHEAWEALKASLIRIDPGFKMTGEVSGVTVGDPYHNVQEMDAILDFTIPKRTMEFVAWNNNIETIIDGGNQIVNRETMLNATPELSLSLFLNNHDIDNLGEQFRNTGKDRTQVDAMLLAAASFMITAKGQPTIYYGEEVGQYGIYQRSFGTSIGFYNTNRYDFDWSKARDPKDAGNQPGNEINQHYRALLNARATFSKAYSKGERTYYKLGEDVLAFSVEHNGEIVLTFINRTDSAQLISLDATASPYNQETKLLNYYAYHKSGENDKEDVVTTEADGSFAVTVPAMTDGGTAILAVEKVVPPPPPPPPSGNNNNNNNNNTNTGGSSSTGSGTNTAPPAGNYGHAPGASNLWNAVNNQITNELGTGSLVGNAANNASGNGFDHVLAVGTDILVPTQIFNTLKGTTATLMLNTGTGVTFSISGSNIPEGLDTTNFDLSLRDGGLNAPPAKVNEVLAGTIKNIEIPMISRESFGMVIGQHFNIGAENAGNFANLYCFNEVTGEFDYLGSYEINAKGQAMFGIAGGADYILTVSVNKPNKPIASSLNFRSDISSYLVVRGDTMAKIAQRNGMTLRQLLALNPSITNPGRIRVGQRIRLR